MDQLQLQPNMNIGTLGHVAHGKSTLVKKLTGVTTMKHSKELPRGITIKLGYANMKIWQCPQCPKPICYSSTGSSVMSSKCQKCSTDQKLIRHISFVDCPGHEALMTTMLNGVSVMDGAILVVAGNEKCPQPQTTEHLISAEIMAQRKSNQGNTLNVVCVQTKLDVIKEPQARQNYQEIKDFVEGTCAEKSPIIPICSHLGLNLDILLEYIVRNIPVPIRDLTKSARIMVIRSFDINKPGTDVDSLQGGVLGGTLQYGQITIGQMMELRPGLIVKTDNKSRCFPIRLRVISLMSERNQLERATPGGLIAIGTDLDPSLTKNDRMVGQILVPVDTDDAPDIYRCIHVEYNLMRRICIHESDQTKIQKPKVGELLRLNVNSMTITSKVSQIKDNMLSLSLDTPICVKIGDSVTLSRSYNKRWRLIGWGIFKDGIPEHLYYP